MRTAVEACNGLWRSEDVHCMDAYVARECLRDTVVQLGLVGKVQLIDLNANTPQFSRPHAMEVRRCDEALRQLNDIEAHLTDVPESCAAFGNDVGYSAPLAEVSEEVSSPTSGIEESIDTIESTLADLDALTMSIQGICHEINTSTEIGLLRESVTKLARRASRWGRSGDNLANSSFDSLEVPVDAHGVDNEAAAAGVNLSSSSLLGLESLPNVLGTIDAARAEAVSRLALRTTHGHAVISVDTTQNAQYVHPGKRESGGPVSICTFSVFSSSAVAVTRLRKLLIGLGATVHSLPDVLTFRGVERPIGDSAAPTAHSSADSAHAVSDLHSTLASLREQREVKLRQWYPQHRRLKTRLSIEKAVAVAMGMCVDAGITCTCAMWVPVRHEQAVRAALETAADLSGSPARPILARSTTVDATTATSPPTYFATDRFTACFQSIVDSYGPAQYKEINPGVLTIITFPYLFGIMYGDIGHGVLLLCLAVFLVSKERHWQKVPLNEMLAMLYGGRYVLLLMALFAIYVGFLYNDFFGFSLNLFASGYTWPSLSNTSNHHSAHADVVMMTPLQPNGRPVVRPTRVCVFGMDAAWAETENKLEYYNSVKMKSAVIVGVVHMLCGLCLSLFNALRRADRRRVWLLVVPEMVFLTATFGYMAWLIILKWGTRWDNTHEAPSILETMTNFFLLPGVVPHPLFTGQAGVQVCLLAMAVAMVPLMLFGMPICEYREHRQWLSRQRERRHTDDNPGLRSAAQLTSEYSPGSFEEAEADAYVRVLDRGDGSGDEWGDAVHASSSTRLASQHASFDLSEVMIHYIIHTIEYVLGSVSNTASYLRLWALSLAHAQLSEVFFNFAVAAPLNADNAALMVGIGLPVWLVVTVGVLVGMEALSAFLHALRLHWVEFQNKFYAGDGHLFTPFSFDQA